MTGAGDVDQIQDQLDGMLFGNNSNSADSANVEDIAKTEAPPRTTTTTTPVRESPQNSWRNPGFVPRYSYNCQCHGQTVSK